MTRAKHFIWVAIIMATFLGPDAVSAQEKPSIIGEVPQQGLAILVMGQELSPIEILSFLTEKGCLVESLWVTKDGGWLGYLPGAPAIVNRPFIEDFSTLPEYTGFIVKCAAPKQVKRTGQADRIMPVQGVDVPLRYECGEAVFEITNWYLPENLTDQRQQGAVFVTYKVSPNGTDYNVLVEVDILDGNKRDLVPLGWRLSGSLVTSMNQFGSVPIGVKDGQFHPADVRIRILTESEVDGGAPHFTAFPKGEHFSDTRLFPFYVGTPPVIWGFWYVDGQRWSIDTRNGDYCEEPVVVGK